VSTAASKRQVPDKKPREATMKLRSRRGFFIFNGVIAVENFMTSLVHLLVLHHFAKRSWDMNASFVNALFSGWGVSPTFQKLSPIHQFLEIFNLLKSIAIYNSTT
jgi:flagellar biosynthesis protein FlhB